MIEFTRTDNNASIYLMHWLKTLAQGESKKLELRCRSLSGLSGILRYSASNHCCFCVKLRPESGVKNRFAGYQPYLLAKEQVGTG
jgi:hypothetical protein